ncbi:YaiI/YqxD family protein [Bacillus sp. HMF5848]|nr:YaiI/YqxD family protein [Bacillus sp. HMF5848]
MKDETTSIIVDADACPSKQDIVNVARTYNVKVFFVASYAHMTDKDLGGQWIWVDSSKESVDLYIINHVKKHDIVVTQDIGLASMIVSRHVYCVSPRGKVYDEKEMDTILELRYAGYKQRRQGERTKGPKRYTEQDRQNLLHSLEKILSKLAGIQQ